MKALRSKLASYADERNVTTKIGDIVECTVDDEQYNTIQSEIFSVAKIALKLLRSRSVVK